jgi:hypothetical protein
MSGKRLRSRPGLHREILNQKRKMNALPCVGLMFAGCASPMGGMAQPAGQQLSPSPKKMVTTR